jgi:hypothetical protein
MSENKRKYYVEAVNRGYYRDDRFETLAEAEEESRKQTHRNGESYGIFQMIHETKVPEQVINIQLEKVT